MKATVKIIYAPGDDKNKELTVELKGAPKGTKLMDAIDKAVEKVMGEDKAWQRWNLLSIVD